MLSSSVVRTFVKRIMAVAPVHVVSGDNTLHRLKLHSYPSIITTYSIRVY